MADIFISYSRNDSEHAKTLAGRLGAMGLSIWMDTASLAAAETWSAEIVDAIKACRALVVLLSAHSVSSANVTKEVALASEKKKTVIPIVIEECELNSAMEYALAGLHQVSLFDEAALERSFEKLGFGAGEHAAVPAESINTHDASLLRIAVLPFEDQSPQHDNEWFSDGLTDELISTLNKLDALFVLDRKSSKIYKDAKMTVKQIAHELNVRYIVTGAVRKAGEKIRIQASLVEAASGATLWDEKFGGTMDDIFEIQEKTALDICEGLKLKLTPEEKNRLEEKMTDSPEVYELLLQAARKINVEQDYPAVLELTGQALAIDPHCLAALYIRSISFSNTYRNDNNPATLEREKAGIKQLMELGPESYYCLAARANYYLNIGESELATEMAERAMHAMPKAARAHSVLGFIYSRAGKPHKAAAAFRKAIELDPTSGNNRVRLLLSLFAAGAPVQELQAEYPAVKVYLNERVAEFPDNIAIRREYLNAAVISRKAEDAVAAAEYLLSHELATPDDEYCSAEAYLLAGDIGRGHELLRLAIDHGQKEFSKWDEAGFISLKGTPEYDFLVSHVVKPHG
jgi:TolB-like protein